MDSAAEDASAHMNNKSSNSPKCPAHVGNLQSCLTSIFEFYETTDFLVYPTISNGEYFIDSENIINQIQVFDNIGTLVYSINNPYKFDTLNLNSMPSGIYFVRINFDQSYGLSKIIKL